MTDKHKRKAERIQVIFNDIKDLLGEIELKLFDLKKHGYDTSNLSTYIDNAHIQIGELNTQNPDN